MKTPFHERSMGVVSSGLWAPGESIVYIVASRCWHELVAWRFGCIPGGGADLAKFRISVIHRFMTSGCRVAALFSREAQRWTPDAIWFLRYFNPQAKGIMYLECREC